MSNLVIVAVPDENDRVWKVSSEKVPHLTLLFLGAVEQVSNLESIVEFVEHAASTTLKRFYLPVDRRGELGDDKADVLFFKKGRYDYKAIRDFRATLLQNANIKTAYDSAQQFDGPWQPHLTLGYPETPANKVSDDQIASFYDVSFNKIAVWTGDFEGPEFLLKDYGDEYDALETVPMDVAMSDIQHFGMKGMKWGVRKDTTVTVNGQTKQVTAKKAGKLEKDWNKEAASSATWVKIHNGSADHFNAHIEALNNKPEYKDLNLNTHPDIPLAKKYMIDVHNLSKEGLEKSVNKLAPSPTGKHKIVVVHGSEFGEWGLALDHAKHAVGEEVTWVKAKINEQGKVVGIEFTMPPAIHTIQLGTEFLEHFGVRGMKWGVRKPPPTAVAPMATSHVPHGAKRKTKIAVEGGENHPAHEDAIKVARAQAKLKKSGPAALSNKELQEVANRLNLERNVGQLVSSTSRIGKGRQFIKGITGANKEVNDTVNTGFQTTRLVRQLR